MADIDSTTYKITIKKIPQTTTPSEPNIQNKQPAPPSKEILETNQSKTQIKVQPENKENVSASQYAPRDNIETLATTEDEDMTSRAFAQGMNIAWLIICVVISVIKDVFEIIIGFIPIGDLASFILSLPLALILGLFLQLAGKKNKFNSLKAAFQSIIKILMQVVDIVPIVSIIPLSTILVIWSFASKKDSKKTEQTTNKIKTMAQFTGDKGQTADKAKNVFAKIASKI